MPGSHEGASRITILAPNIVREARLPKRVMKRARLVALPETGETDLLARVFGIDTPALPAAPLHYLGMTGRDPEGYCLFAYPVHLHARRDHLVLMTGAEFELDEQEALAIIETLREYYPHWRVERTGDAMWFIITDETPDLETTPLHTALGEDINEHLPRGDDAMEWLRTMNELQMILFDTRVNREREAAGRPPLNSLWFWGGGRLPDVRVRRWRRLVTDNPVALGIGRCAGMETRWLESAPAAEGGPAIIAGDTLWICSGVESRTKGEPVISNAQWQALQEALRLGDIERLTLVDPGHGELTIEPRHARSWLPWR